MKFIYFLKNHKNKILQCNNDPHSDWCKTLFNWEKQVSSYVDVLDLTVTKYSTMSPYIDSGSEDVNNILQENIIEEIEELEFPPNDTIVSETNRITLSIVIVGYDKRVCCKKTNVAFLDKIHRQYRLRSLEICSTSNDFESIVG